MGNSFLGLTKLRGMLISMQIALQLEKVKELDVEHLCMLLEYWSREPPRLFMPFII
jgi:hypothetical protein